MKKSFLLLTFHFFISAINYGYACSSAVISGKVTPDGRPLLWKHRDTDFPENNVKYFTGTRFSFIGIVNSTDSDPQEVWIGTNSSGFSIMNTQSYNLVDIHPGEERGEANGRVMCQALSVCADLDDFRNFLDTLSKPSFIEANLGVIDAKGGASLFEVDYFTYVEYDANSTKDAPFGYIARTNFSFSGKVNDGGGYVRYMEVEHKMIPASATRSFTPSWIFTELSRSFTNQMLGIDLKTGDYNKPKTTGWFIDQDFIPRKSTASSVVIQGVKAGENPELTVMWTILGYPPVSVAVPVWMKLADKGSPEILFKNDTLKVSPLCGKVISLTDRIFSYKQGIGSNRYFNWELLFNAAGTGYMQMLAPVEESIFAMSRKKMEEWRKTGGINEIHLNELYNDLEAYILESYYDLFGL